MSRKASGDRGVRTVESGVDPGVLPAEDTQSGDEGIDEVRSDSLQDQKEPLDPPEQKGIEDQPREGD